MDNWVEVEARKIVNNYFETIKVNKLFGERQLVYLFDNLSKMEIDHSESLENLISCSDKMPKNIKIKDKK